MNRQILILLCTLSLAACGDAPKPSAAPAAATPAAPLLQLSDTQQREAGVRIAAAAPAEIAETLTVYGEISATDDRLRRISARYPGIAREVLKKVGDSVRAGDTLVVVESNDSLVPYRISAPIAGRVLERHVNPGEAMSEQNLFVIADLSRVWAQLSVFPADAARVSPSQRVEVRAEREAEAQSASIEYVAPDADSAARRVRVRATLDNADGRWRPGQFVAADIVVAQHSAAVAVPQSALQDIDGQPHVFVRSDQGFAARALRLGRQDRRNAEVLEGLKAGENVVVANSYLLKSEWLSREE